MNLRILLGLSLLAGRFAFAQPMIFPLAGPAADTPSDIPAEVIAKVDPSVVSIQHERAGGSGFIISEDGYILTNGHVIRGEDPEEPTRPARSITVILHNDRKFPARVLGFSMDPDVALLKIDADVPLKPVEFADSRNVSVGRRCFAVGTPVGLKRTFTGGILSNVERTDLAQEIPVFQTDAAINSGNSGGPLFDQQGRVLGLNTYASSNRNNLGFTIPIHVALDMVEDLKTRGRFIRSLVPLYFTSELYDELARALQHEDGILVTYVMDGSSAEKMGLRKGDIIVELDGKAVAAHTHAELLRIEWDHLTLPAGQPTRFTVLRGKAGERERITLEATLEELEPMPQFGRHAGELIEHRYVALGLGVKQIVSLHHIIHEVPHHEGGVLVKYVAPNSVASRADIQPLDQITRVGATPISSILDFRKAFDAELAAGNPAIEIQIVRKKLRFVSAIAPDYPMKNRRVALIAAAEGSEDVDLIRRELLARGAKIDLVTPAAASISRPELGDSLPATLALADLKPAEYDVVLFAGGPGARAFGENADALRVMREAIAAKCQIAAIGTSALLPVLASEKPLDKKITLLREDSGEAVKRGATYTGKDIESDGQFHTTTGLERSILRDFLNTVANAGPRGEASGSSPESETTEDTL